MFGGESLIDKDSDILLFEFSIGINERGLITYKAYHVPQIVSLNSPCMIRWMKYDFKVNHIRPLRVRYKDYPYEYTSKSLNFLSEINQIILCDSLYRAIWA